jgi:energy-coupling factor transporter ATP-binding protein EcfA2
MLAVPDCLKAEGTAGRCPCSQVIGSPLVLKDVTLNVGPGARVALVGANGEGKSTLVKLLTGELSPTRGEVRRHQQARVGVFNQNQVRGPFCGARPDARHEARGRSLPVPTMAAQMSGTVLPTEKTLVPPRPPFTPRVGALAPRPAHQCQVRLSVRSRFGSCARQVEELLTRHADSTPLAYLKELFPERREQDLRGSLGAFGIKGSQATQRMATLSGGQAVRVALAAALLPAPHLVRPAELYCAALDNPRPQALLALPCRVLAALRDIQRPGRPACRGAGALAGS